MFVYYFIKFAEVLQYICQSIVHLVYGIPLMRLHETHMYVK